VPGLGEESLRTRLRGVLTEPRALVLSMLLAVGTLQLLYQVGLLLKGTDFIVSRLTCDDTFYFLQTAWNTKNTGIVTFDGLHETNGVQLLWHWLLVLVAFGARSKAQFLLYSLLVCVFLNALGYVLIWKIGSVVWRPIFIGTMGILWFYSNVTGAPVYLSGMENSLHALLVWIIAWWALRTFNLGEAASFSDLTILVILLVLNAWARLDAGLLSVVVFACCLLVCVRGKPIRAFIGLFGVAGLGAFLAAGMYYWMGGFVMPVSGMIKTLHYSRDVQLFVRLFSRGFDLITPLRYAVWHASGKQYHGLAGPLVLAVAASGASGILLYRRNLWPRALAYLWGAYAIANALYLLFVAGLGTFAEYGVWYLSPYFVFSIITLAVCADSVVAFLESRKWYFSRLIATFATVLSIILFVTFVGRWSQRSLSDQDYRQGLYYERLQLARWIHQNTEKDSILASFNAGEIGYFSERSVINLDGLANSYEYYIEVIRGDITLLEYLHANEVRYFADYRIPSELLPASRAIYSREVDATRTLYVLDLYEMAYR